MTNFCASTAQRRRARSNLSDLTAEFCSDRAQWNDRVIASGGGLYQSWEWGEWFRARGWQPWRVLVCRGGSVRAALTIVERRLWVLPFTILYAPAAVPAGPSDAEAVAYLLSRLRVFAADRRAVLLRFDAWFGDRDVLASTFADAGCRHLQEQWTRWNHARTVMTVDISGPEHEVLARMSKTHRYYIRRARRGALTIERGTDERHIAEFYSLVKKSSERSGFAIRNLDQFLKLREILCVDGDAAVFIARDQGRSVAAILCTRFGKDCHYIHGGFDWTERHAYATQALHWEAILWARANACTRYDLAGAGTNYPPIENAEGYAMFHFKKGFGAQLLYSAGYYDLVTNPAVYRMFRAAERQSCGWSGAALLRGRAMWQRIRGRG